MGRFTEIALPKDFIDYSRKLPEALLYKAAQDLDKKIAETDALSAGINKLFDIKLAPSQQSQEDYKRITSSYIKEKNEINDAAMKDPSNIAQHNARIKQLASKISDDATAGQLKALKEQGEEYWGSVAAKQQVYKDTPELFNWWKKNKDINLTNAAYNTDLGTYGTIAEPTMYANVTPEEAQKWLSAEIAATSKFENANEMTVRRLVSGATSNLVGVTGQDRKAAERITEILKNSVPQEYINSFNQYNNATGYIDPTTGKVIDESAYWDHSGKTFNKTTRLGRALHAGVLKGMQEDVQITSIPNAGSIRNSSSSSNSSSGAAYHSWYVHPAVKAAGDALDNISNDDIVNKTAALNRLVTTADKLTDSILDNREWVNDEQYLKNGYVTPFMRGKMATSDGKINTFEPTDIIFDPKNNILKIKKISGKQENNTQTATDWKERLDSMKATGFPIPSPYTTFNLSDEKQRNLAKQYIIEFGFKDQNFAPQPNVSVKNTNISEGTQEALINNEFNVEEPNLQD